jgi:hypothetical protein
MRDRCKEKSRNSNKIFAAKERKEHRDKNLWSFPLCQGNVCQGNGRGPRLDYSPDNHSPDFSPALPILRWSSPCSFWLRLAALGSLWFSFSRLRLPALCPFCISHSAFCLFFNYPLTKIRTYDSLFKHERRKRSQFPLRQAPAGCLSVERGLAGFA